ncbi:dockerin type I domain-containing protein [Candidatus Zixiibacteriota bacterium]
MGQTRVLSRLVCCIVVCGFIASTTVTGQEECDCFVWGDFNLDGEVNPLDVSYAVKCVYFTCPFELNPHPNCPWEVMDVNCDGSRNPLDVTCYVNYVYKGLPWALVNCTDADGNPATTDDIGCE